MIQLRSLAQLAGLLFLAGAVAGLAYEGNLMLNTGTYRVVSLAELWSVVHRPSIDLVRTSLDSGTWNLLLKTYLGWPNWAGLALPGAILLMLSVRKTTSDTVLRKLPIR